MRLHAHNPLPAGAKYIALLAAFVLTFTAVACGNGEDDPDDPGSLVIYSGRAEDLVGPLIQRFEDQTGIDVVVEYGGSPTLAATILEEGTQSPADVFFSQDPGALGAVEELLTPLPASVLDRVEDWARSPEDLWVGISGRARVLVYNVDSVDPSELPADIWDLTDPQWEGRVGWAPTNGSFITMVTGMRSYWGEEMTREWLEGMVANDPTIYPNNTSQVEAAGRGEIDVGVVNHYYLYRFLAEQGEGFGARNFHHEGGPGALMMIAGTGILETASNRENAEEFLAFLLEDDSQQYFADETFEYPVVPAIETHELLTPMEEINRPDITMADMVDLEGTEQLLREAGAMP